MSDRSLGHFDLVVVGAGMIGSAAAYHATCMLPAGTTVCLVGTGEPQSRTQDPHRSIFGSWYDEGRITRSSDKDPVWSVLSQRSFPRLLQLQAASGIKIVHEVGSLTVIPKGNEEMLQTYQDSYQQQKLPVVTSMWENLKHVPSLKPLSFRPENKCIYEMGKAGHMSPRSTVKAFQQEASKKGCTILRHVVHKVGEPIKEGSMCWRLTMDSGEVIHAKKVLIATGAFTAFRDLLPGGIKPNIWLKTQTVLFAEIRPEDMDMYRNMPSVVNIDSPRLYMLPPIKYPDGRFYIKIGHGDQFEQDVTTEEQIRSWFQGQPPPHHKEGLLQILLTIIPGLKPASLHTDHCVSTRTPSRRPFIDLLRPSLGVALGGNGYAAKSCDELGRLAATLLIQGRWTDPELKHSDFKFVPESKL